MARSGDVTSIAHEVVFTWTQPDRWFSREACAASVVYIFLHIVVAAREEVDWNLEIGISREIFSR